MSKKTHVFKAEVQQVLDLVIHSLYSKKEIFLRELVSNASDAIDRANYLGLTDKTLVDDAPDWRIDIVADKEEKTLMVVDNGIGMSEEDLDKHLGVIASSGTKAFAKAMEEGKQGDLPTLIGQFGVGFYAAFMVASKVTVITRKRGQNQKAVKWSSAGDGSYTIEDAARDQPGTTISLTLREGMEEYLDEWRVRSLVKQYSDFIAYPVRFSDKGEAPEADVEPLNTMKALWKRPWKEVEEEESNEFYTHLTHDHQPPLKAIHMAVEGVIEFKALLYLPRQAGFDLMMPNKKHGLSLYVRNVFIGSDLEMLLPDYLRFVRGVVESGDLPLNVSREMLQDDAVTRKIKSNITGKVLSTLAEMMRDDLESYLVFYRDFGRVLKEGVHSDWENGDKLKALLLFTSARQRDNELLSLKQYVEAMPESQKDIYYLIAEDSATARHSPHIESAVAHGYDVLFLTDPIDQWLIDSLREFDGRKLVAVDKGDLELGSEEERAETKKKIETASGELKELMEFIKEKLGDDVKEVRLSPRLTDSACCLVADEHAMTAQMERLMRAMNQEVPKQSRILELNANHKLIERMRTMFAEDRGSQRLEEYVELLHGQALVAEGSTPKDAQRFTHLVAGMMADMA